jgi:uncharacterized protein YidB (DUF937 family)
MGLRDILTGMQNGPHGQRQPTSGGGGGGMSPLVIALLGLLAYKAFKGRGGQTADAGAGGQTARLPQGGTAEPGNAGGGLGDILGGLLGGKPANAPAGTRGGGSLGDLLSGGLGGLLGGAAAGSVLSGGLDNLIKGFQDSGHGHAAESWVGTGPNKDIAANDLADALGSDTLDTLSQRTGMPQGDLLEALRHQLPGFVDQLTPHGRIPTEGEASRMV